MGFFQTRKVKKQVKALLHQAGTLRASREDILDKDDLAELDGAIQAVRRVYPHGTAEEMDKAGTGLEACIGKLNPPKSFASLRENFDVLVVAIGVAMAFRAYFYQPFKIPTGSMQPTLYGIHSESEPAQNRTALDRQPLKFLKWLVTGESFQVIESKATGTVRIVANGKSTKPGYTPVVVSGVPHYVPNDVVGFNNVERKFYLNGGVQDGDYVHAGSPIWSGVVTSGDFVFVNRWLWNFRHPQRGEVMVFATTGINGLQQGTHYIKRMMGLPGESLQIKSPYVYVNGEPVKEPKRIAQIAAKEKLWAKSPAYAGFNPNPTDTHQCAQSIGNENDRVDLTKTQYYAMGDNSMNSFDSRYWGSVPERNLLGPATFVYWPFTSPRAGFIH